VPHPTVNDNAVEAGDRADVFGLFKGLGDQTMRSVEIRRIEYRANLPSRHALRMLNRLDFERHRRCYGQERGF
jgi:hypothetical protein